MKNDNVIQLNMVKMSENKIQKFLDEVDLTNWDDVENIIAYDSNDDLFHIDNSFMFEYFKYKFKDETPISFQIGVSPNDNTLLFGVDRYIMSDEELLLFNIGCSLFFELCCYLCEGEIGYVVDNDNDLAYFEFDDNDTMEKARTYVFKVFCHFIDCDVDSVEEN